MRFLSVAGLTLLVLLILALELLSAGDALEYRRALLATEPWRLLTGHFVHLSLVHATLNAVALLLLDRLLADRLRRGEWWALLLGTPIPISLLLWAVLPGLAWYRGLSDVLHALFFGGGIVWFGTAQRGARRLPIIALLLGAVKVLYEQPWDASFPFRDWLGAAVVPQAHLVGAMVGTATGCWLLARRRRPAAISPS